MKLCKRCQTEKPYEAFSKQKATKDGYMTLCKPCNSERVKEWQQANPERVKKSSLVKGLAKHQLTEPQYNQMLEEQNGRCFVCQDLPSQTRLPIDHDHTCCPGTYSCGRCIRGLLCHRCNRALGLLRDDRNNVIRLLEYMDRW